MAVHQQHKTKKFRVWVCLALCIQMGGGYAQTTLGESKFQSPESALDERSFVQLLTERSLELRFGKQSVDVASLLALGEAGIYEPVVYGSMQKGGTERQRTPLETETALLGDLNSLKKSDLQSMLDESSRQVEFGVRMKTSTGGQIAVSVKQDERNSNVLRALSYPLQANAVLGLNYKQPLLRGRGSVAVETDMRVAELERQVTEWQYVQQLQKTVAEGLSNFWQMYTSDEVVKARRELVHIATAMAEDARVRVRAGKLSALALGQVERDLAVRQSDVLRAEQTQVELKLRLLSSLNLSQSELDHVQLSAAYGATNFDTITNIEQALQYWAPYQIARLHRDQGMLRLAFARNQSLPAADLVMSYGKSGLNKDKDAWKTAIRENYPDWYVGVNVELGMWNEQRATAQLLAQERRVSQSDTELEAIRISFANDWFTKQQAWQRAQQELVLMQAECDARERVWQAEQKRLKAGMGSQSATWAAQQDAIESQIRLLDAKGRAESTRLSLLLAQGNLLSSYGISFEISQGS